MDHDGNLRHLVYNMDRVRCWHYFVYPRQQIQITRIQHSQAVSCMDEANGIGKMVVVLDCHNYR